MPLGKMADYLCSLPYGFRAKGITVLTLAINASVIFVSRFPSSVKM